MCHDDDVMPLMCLVSVPVPVSVTMFHVWCLVPCSPGGRSAMSEAVQLSRDHSSCQYEYVATLIKFVRLSMPEEIKSAICTKYFLLSHNIY